MPAKSPKRITLHEAITWLMGEERLTPDAELASIAADVRELECLVEACRLVWPQGGLQSVAGAPGTATTLESWPPWLLLEQLGPISPEWPEPMRALAEAAARQTSYWSKRLHDQKALLQVLLREARGKNITIYGKRDERLGHVVLSPDDLRGLRCLSQDFQDLIPDRDTALRRFGEADENAAVFFDVRVTEVDIRKLLRGADVSIGPREWEPEPSLETVVEWIKNYPEFIEFSLERQKGYAKQELELVRAFPGVTNAKATLKAANEVFSFRKPRGRPKKEPPKRPAKR